MSASEFVGAIVTTWLAWAPASVAGGPLSPELVLSLRSAADVAMSPDGGEVLFRRDRPRGADEPLGADVGELWRASSSGGEARRIIDVGFDARSPRWSPDGRHIAWLARTGPDAKAEVHVAVRDGSMHVVLTQQPGAVQALEWSPDSTRVAFTAWDVAPDAQRAAIKQGRDWIVVDAKPKQLRLYVVDLEGRAVHLVTQAELSVHHFAWSPDSSQFVIGAAPTPTDDDRALKVRPFLVSAAGGEPRQIADIVGRVTDPCWSSDGQWIAWLGSTELADPWAGSVFAVSTIGGAPRLLTAGFEGTATSLQPLPGRAAEFVFRSEEKQTTALRVVNAADGTQRLLAAPSQVLASAPSFDRLGRAFAIAANAPQHPNEVFIGRTTRPGSLTRLTDSNPQLSGVQLARQEIARWKSRDGVMVEGVLIRPLQTTPGQRHPIVLHVHGGSESVALNGWQAGYNNFGQLLAARGYAVLYPNYRGSRGRGVAYVMGNRRDIMGREWEDIESGLDHVIAMGLADGERAAIFGFSWGGYAAAWGATYASHRFRAAVAGAGIYNWISEAGTNDTRMHEQLAHWDEPLYQNFQSYLQRSPIYHINRARTPVLLLHGERDESCPVTQAVEFHTALKWRRVPVELVIYPREGHGMDEPAHRTDFLTRGLGWFDQHLHPPERPSEISAALAPLGGAEKPGCSAGVYRDGVLVEAAASGAADVERHLLNNARTVFNIGSVSKHFTAFAVLLLAQRGELSLDDPVIKHVPELRDSATGVTLRHLLHHTGGLRDYLGLMLLEGAKYEDRTTREQALSVLRRQRAANSLPGVEYDYSNTGYFLLGLTVERVSGRPLREFMHDEVFAPLGMKSTSIVDHYPSGIAELARGYSPSGNGAFAIDESTWEQTGDGQVHTTIQDMARWERNLLQGTLGGPQLQAAMVEPGKLASGQRIDYAAGLSLWHHRGLPTVSHAGDWAGYSAHYLRFPQQKYAVAVLCNRSDIYPGEYATAIADRQLQTLMQGDVEARGLAFLRTRGGGANPATMPQGVYRDGERGSYVSLQSAQGKYQLSMGQEVSTLSEAAPGIFHASAFGRVYAVFEPAKGAQVARIVLQDSPQPRRFEFVKSWRPATLSAYAGVYAGEETSTRLEIVARGDTLLLRADGVDYTLQSITEQEFTGAGLIGAGSPFSIRFVPQSKNRQLLLFIDGVRALRYERARR